MKYFFGILIVCAITMCGMRTTFATDQAVDRAAIEKSVESYVAAFNSGDSAALAAHWSPDAIYTNPGTGNQAVGHEAIQKEFDMILTERKGDKLEVDVESIEFISPNVAVENGMAIVTAPEGAVEVSHYTAVHVKRDGKWLLDRVSEEEEAPVVASHYDQLKDLEWMIGTWIDQGEGNQIETTCQWARNNNYIIRSFKVVIQDNIDTSGMQIIGWDPASKKIRSWAFDSNGGFAEGTWTKNENRWIVNSNSTLPDGQRGSSINIMTVVDENTFGWQSTGREVDGSILPNIEEVLVTRLAIPK